MINKFNLLIFYFFLFCLPWQTIFIFREIKINNEKFQYGTIGIYFFEIILFFWIFSSLYLLKKYTDKKMLLFVLFFTIFSLLSVLWSADKLFSVGAVIPLLMGIFSFLILQKKFLRFKIFTFIFILSIFLQGILGINQFLTQSITSNKWLGISSHLAWQGGTSVVETSSERFLRAYGGMAHPNILGGFLTIAILLAIGAYLKSTTKEIFWRYFLLISIFTNFFSLIVTFSRSAFIALLMGLLLFYIYYVYNKKSLPTKNLLLFIALFVFIGIFFFLSLDNLFINRFTGASRLEQKSISERTVFIQEAQKIIIQKPIFGTGLGGYTSFLIQNNNIPKEVWQIQPVHNIYFLIFAELGIIGFSFFMFIVIFVVSDFLESFTKENINRVIFSIIIISLLILSIFDHWIWTTHSGIIIFWILLGFSREKTTNSI